MNRAAHPSRSEVGSQFAKRVLFVAAIAVLAVVIWQLLGMLLLVFGAVIVAIALRALSRRLEKYAKVPPRWSVMTAVLLVVVLCTGIGWLIGDPLSEQLGNLRERLPNASAAVSNWLKSHRAGQMVLDLIGQARESEVPWDKLFGVAAGVVGAAGAVVVILFTGVYLALDPRLYRDGLVRLAPYGYREPLTDALDESGEGLARWLLGQSISMLFIGTATAIGLWALGIPLALAVGVISGILAFVPFFGPIAGGLLAILVAFGEGPESAFYVLLLVLGIEQVEGNLLMPLVQKWAVQLAPAVAVVSTVGFGALFGLPGALLATPLTVVAIILVRKLYIEGHLEQDEADRVGN